MAFLFGKLVFLVLRPSNLLLLLALLGVVGSRWRRRWGSDAGRRRHCPASRPARSCPSAAG